MSPDFPPCRRLEFAGGTVLVYSDADSACLAAAQTIAGTIKEAMRSQGKAVLGLATGGTPILVYEHLVSFYKAGDLSFQRVSTYNLDEYYPIHPSDPNSYRAYMHRHLFDHVDIRPNRAHVLDGTVPEAFAAAHAAEFERWIAAEGGLDLQLLGIGRNGHIGFNEPSDLPVEEALRLPTRLVALDPITLADAAADFGVESAVIPRALTLGVGPILTARSIVLLALGPKKAEPVALALTGPITPRVPASLLRSVNRRVTWMLDEAAAQGLG